MYYVMTVPSLLTLLDWFGQIQVFSSGRSHGQKSPFIEAVLLIKTERTMENLKYFIHLTNDK